MARKRSTPSVLQRRLIAVGALLGWLMLILVAAGRSVPTEFWIGLPDLSNLIAAIWLLALVAGVVLLAGPKGVTPAPPQATRRGRWFMWVVLALVLLLAAADPDFLERLQLDPEESVELDEPEEIEFPEEETLPPPDIQIEASHVYLLLSALGVALIVRQLSRRRQNEIDIEPTPAADEELVDELAAVVDRAQIELQQGGQPRQRVMAAYAEVERILAGEHLGRRLTETPSEHLTRVLAAVPINADPLVALGRLYELARYSNHPITIENQQQAAAALEQTQAELANRVNGGTTTPGSAEVNI